MPYANPEAQREYQRAWMAKRRREFLEGKSCAFCGSSDDLELHHFDPGAKTSHRLWSWSEEKRKAEIAKCMIVCRGCHTRHHAEQRMLAYCKRGHEFTDDNVYVKPSTGRRECRKCRELRRAA